MASNVTLLIPSCRTITLRWKLHRDGNNICLKSNPTCPFPPYCEMEASLFGCFQFLIFIAPLLICIYMAAILLTFRGLEGNWSRRKDTILRKSDTYACCLLTVRNAICKKKLQSFLFFAGREGDLKKKVQSPLFSLVGACSDSFLIFTAASQQGLSHHPASLFGELKIKRKKDKKK